MQIVFKFPEAPGVTQLKSQYDKLIYNTNYLFYNCVIYGHEFNKWQDDVIGSPLG